jgi:thymidylate synthase
MAQIDKTYHSILEDILQNGFKYEDPNRKGINRIQIPSTQITHNFENSFPAITTKKLYWKGVVGELLWFLRGDTNIKYLVDNGINIWDKDAYNYSSEHTKWDTIEDFIKEVSQRGGSHHGDLGRIYGYQLRNFGGEFDQLKWLINTLKTNPLATKKTVTYINPNDKEHQALSPCHTGFKILVEPVSPLYMAKHSDKTKVPYKYDGPLYQFTLQWEQDSVDTFLGLPFNIASYALLAHIIGKLTNMIPKSLIGDLSNVHIYEPHLDAVKEQLSRDTDKYEKCELGITSHIDDLINNYNQGLHPNKTLDELFNNFRIKDFKLLDYNSYPKIKAEMLAYNK